MGWVFFLYILCLIMWNQSEFVVEVIGFSLVNIKWQYDKFMGAGGLCIYRII